MKKGVEKLYAEVGGLFMVGLPGPDLDASTKRLIEHYRINDFIIFRRNVVNPEQLGDLCLGIAEHCALSGLPAPLISIDQEGGTVARLPAPFSQFPDMRLLAESEDAEAALADYARTCARELKGIGINMNLAPVLDVSPAGKGYFMERRALGGVPSQVAALASVVIKGMQQEGVAACGKHFPGLGTAVLDPHLLLPVITNDDPENPSGELLPFKVAIDSGVAAIMTCHAVYPKLDDGLPATLSRKILGGLLRDKLGFSGVVITDDLEMGAIENHRDVPSAAVDSFAAGADMLLICHDHGKIIAAVDVLATALAEENISGEQVECSRSRIDRMRAAFSP